MSKNNLSLPKLGWIASDQHNDGWVCICGNENDGDGFTALSITRAYDDGPRQDSGFIICQACGRVIDPKTHRFNKKADPEDDYQYKVKVVGFVPIPDSFFELFVIDSSKAADLWMLNE